MNGTNWCFRVLNRLAIIASSSTSSSEETGLLTRAGCVGAVFLPLVVVVVVGLAVCERDLGVLIALLVVSGAFSAVLVMGIVGVWVGCFSRCVGPLV